MAGNDLKAVVETSPQAFKVWVGLVGFALLIGGLGVRVTSDIGAITKASEKNEKSIQQLVNVVGDVVDGQKGIINDMENHERFGQHRNSKPDIDRIDRTIFEIQTEMKSAHRDE